MTSRLLQIVGVVTILGLLGAVAAGFGVLKDRVRIVVVGDETDAGPDPTALLRDDVQTLAGRLDGLQQAIVANFGQLADGLEGRANERHGDVLALRRKVDRLAADLATLTGKVAAVHDRVADRQSAGSQSAGSQGTAEPPPPEPVAVQEPESEPEPTKGTGFLTFKLPQTNVAFDRPQRFQLLTKLCRVGFDARSTLHDFTGVTSAVAGSFRVDFDDPDGLCQGEVVVDAKTLVTGVEGRDENMYEHLDVAHHRHIRFAVERFVADPNGVDVAGHTAHGKVVGKMTIRGKTRALSMPVKFELDPQQRLVVTGQTKLKLTDYEVPVPSQLGLINMEDEVVVWIALRARSQGEAK